MTTRARETIVRLNQKLESFVAAAIGAYGEVRLWGVIR